MLYQLEGGDTLLHLPPIDNAMNIVDHPLMTRTYKSWADAFFSKAQLQKHTYLATCPMYSVFSRSNSVIGLTYTFDRGMKFTPGSPRPR